MTVCTPPAQGHRYWIVDRADDDQQWYVKVQVVRFDGPHTYTVELREDALPGSGRTFYVVESYGEGNDVLGELSQTGNGTDSLPTTVSKASDGVHAIK